MGGPATIVNLHSVNQSSTVDIGVFVCDDSLPDVFQGGHVPTVGPHETRPLLQYLSGPGLPRVRTDAGIQQTLVGEAQYYARTFESGDTACDPPLPQHEASEDRERGRGERN